MAAITARRLSEGVWEARVEGAQAVTVTHQGRTLPDVTLAGGVLRVPLPPETLSDGVQTYVVSDTGTGEVLGSFALVAGEPLAQDVRAELELLRAELDMLKRAFRRHCLETGA
jgi:hypothetical protein